jgi:glutathione peroxidase
MSALDFQANNITGQAVDLKQYTGQVLLIVNTASQCGYTAQYQGLQQLHEEFQAQGFQVLGFPCNQFGFQEPGTSSEIANFCEKNFGVSFPLFEKVNVNGSDAHPLFQYLKRHAPGILGTEGIKWNFTKFLIKKDGQVFKRYPPTTTPQELRADVLSLIADVAG